MDSASRPNESIADSRYFCHSCDAEIGTKIVDFTCPTCHLGFIRQIEEQRTAEKPDKEDMELANDNFMVNGSLGDSEIDGRRRSNIRRQGFTTRGPDIMTLRPVRDNAIMYRHNAIIEDSEENSIVNFADNARSGGSPVGRYLLENLNDYDWEGDGLDSVSQLIFQIDRPGPLPPLTKEKIQKIPTALISQDHLDMKLKCSICWQDFAINEKVKKLACDHMYHRRCIIPWLKLHCTCPICRKNLADDGLSSINSDQLGNSLGVGQNLAASIRTRSQRRNNNLVRGMNSSSSDRPAQLGINLLLPTVSSSSATQTPATSASSIYSYIAARNLRLGAQRLLSSSADVERMDTDHDQNLPAVNNANNF